MTVPSLNSHSKNKKNKTKQTPTKFKGILSGTGILFRIISEAILKGVKCGAIKNMLKIQLTYFNIAEVNFSIPSQENKTTALDAYRKRSQLGSLLDCLVLVLKQNPNLLQAGLTGS